MKLLTALAQYIESLPGITRDQIDAFADLGTLAPTGKDLSNGFEVGRFKYDAVIDIDRCPARIAPLLLAGLVLWLAKNDPERDEMGLEDPDIDVTLEDDQTVFVQITVAFKESVQIVEDENGLLEWDDKTWAVADIPIYVAESGTVERG
jgi:hypothetical protein